jgi:hypothetical protein
MASVDLALVWIYNVADPSNAISAGSMGSMGTSSSSGSSTALVRSDVTTSTGAARLYANGNVRWVSTVGTAEVYSCTLRALSAAQVTLLKSWIGQTCLLRDRLAGRQLWGSFPAVAVGDYMGGNQYHDASFTFSVLSYTDQV